MSERTRVRLARLMADDHPDLAEANLLICAEAHPELDVGRALDRVDALAARAATGGVVDTLRADGYHGAVDDYDAPEHSLLSDVLETRRGLPIALSTLALAMAQRIEAPMAGVGMPGHFILADLRGAEPAYIDPFNGWSPLGIADCARLVRDTTGMPFRREFLRPVPEQAILIRTLLNLRGSYTRRRRTADTLWTVELSLILAPGEPQLVRDGVVLLSAAGRYDEAEAAAAAFLADRPDDPAAPALEAQLDTVRQLRRRMKLTSSAITGQVLAANRRFYDALERLDIDAMEACWTVAPGVACLHPGGPWQRGWDEVREGWEAILGGTGYIEFEIADVEVTVNDPVAWVTCVERITSSAAGGGGTGAAEVAATNLFVLGTDGWRMTLHHASPIIRPAPREDDE